MINMLFQRMMSSATLSVSAKISHLTYGLMVILLLSACGGDYSEKDPFRSDDDTPPDNTPQQTIVPIVSLSDVQVLEGSNGDTQGVIAVTINPVSETEFSLPISISNGTASASDFLLAQSELTIPANTGATSIPFTVTGDTEVEENEFFTVAIAAIEGVSVDKSDAIITIIDDDLPTLSATNLDVIEGESGTITISLSSASNNTVSIEYSSSSGTATGAQDYVTEAGTLTFQPGETTQTITLSTIEDDIDEGPENLSFSFFNSVGTIALTPTITINIIDDDTPNPSIVVNNAIAAEGNDPQGIYRFTVNLSAPANAAGSVEYTVSPDVNNNEYISFAGTLTFPTGISTQFINVPLIGNSRDQFDSTLNIVFSNPNNLMLPVSSPTVLTVVDDDEVPVLNIADASFQEGNIGESNFVTFSATLSQPSGKPVSVNYLTINDTAVGGVDYESTQGQINFAPGSNTPQSISIPIIENNLDQTNRDFFLVLSGLTNVTLNNSVVRGTIVDDDGVSALTVSNNSIQEGDATNSIAIPIMLQPASGLEVTVDYVISNGSAVLGEDYNVSQSSGSITFQPGSTEESIIVDLLGDTLDDDDRGFTITLNNATSADIAQASATITLLDDDPQPELNIQDLTINEASNSPSALAFFVTPSAPSKKQIEVNYTSTNNSSDPNAAVLGTDYSAISGTLTLLPEETNAIINLSLIDNSLDQFDRSFLLNLSSPINANLPVSSSTITIEDDDPEPTIGLIPNTSANEGNDPNNRNSMVFEVELSAPSGKPVTFTYSTQDGTAEAGNDYEAQSGTESFNANGDSVLISVPLESNLFDEPNRNFSLLIENPENTTITQASANGEIIDDDGAPAVTILDTNLTEGNNSNVQNVQVQMSAASGRDVTVDYSIIAGSATEGEDYSAVTTGTLTFLAAQQDTLALIPITVLGDLQDDDNRSFTIFLSNPTSAIIADNDATITIEDDDQEPQIEFSDLNIVEGSAAQAIFELTVNPPSKRAISFDFTTSLDSSGPNPAQEPLDYSSRSDTVLLTANTSSQQISIPINNNALDQFDRTFLLEFSNSNNATFPDATAVITIEDDDAEPSISMTNVSALEGGPASNNTLDFVATLSDRSGKPVSFNYTTTDETAIQGTDYSSQSGTANFNSSGDPITISVPVIGNNIDQQNRTLTLDLSSASNAIVDTSSATGEIRDDDGEPTIEIFSDTLLEGNAENTQQVSVALVPASGLEVTVDYVITNGTAQSGEDYTAVASGTLTFPGNQGITEQFIDVSVLGDTMDDENRNFTIQLSSANNAVLGNDTATITIQDDDNPPTLTVSSSNIPVTEGDDNSTIANFEVSLTAPSKRTPTVSYTTANGSAIAGEDYETTSGTITFDDPQQLTRNISVPINGDLLDDDNRSFTLNFSNGQHLTISNATGTIEIIDDDLPPTVSIVDTSTTEGDAGTQSIPVTINLSAPSNKTITVDIATADGSALAGQDYVATNSTVALLPNTTSNTASVTIINNLYDELARSFTLGITSASDATIDTNADTATVTINDNDLPPTITVSDFNVSEASDFAQLVLTTSAPTKLPVSLTYSTIPLSATAPEDFTAVTNASPTFSSFDTQNPQPSTATIQIDLQDNPYDQTDRNFRIDFSNIANTSLSQSSVEVTIQDDDSAPTLIISATTADILEGNDNSTLATFNVTLSEGTLRTATVDFTTTNGSAIAGDDYVSTSGTLTFDDVSTVSQEFTVPINGDLLDDDNRTFFIDFSNASNLSLDNTRAAIQILDDDIEPTLIVSTNAVDITEGNDTSTVAEFTVSLSTGSNRSPQVNFTTSDGEALAGEDFVSTSGTLTFDDPNVLTQTISVPINGDLLDDDDIRSFDLDFSSAVNLVLDNTTGTININDDDLPPVISIGSNSITEGDSGFLQAPLTLTLSSVSKRAITADYATSNGSALAGIDYVGSSGTATIPANSISGVVNTDIINNQMDEPNRAYNVQISNPVNVTIDTNNDIGQVTIEDNDDAPTITISDFSVSESAGFANLVLTTDNPTRQSVAMLYSTVALTAVAGEDYTTATNVPVVIDAYDPQNPQLQTTTIQIPIQANNFDEDARTFRIDFDQVLNATLSQSSVTVTITDDDLPPELDVSSTPVIVTEGDDNSTQATFSVTLSAWSKKSPTINFATADGNALAGEDYVSNSGSLTFDDQNNLTQEITININGDLYDDEDRSFSLNFTSDPEIVTLSNSAGTITIEDDDDVPSFVVSATTLPVTEGSDNTTRANFTVSLSQGSKLTPSVAFTTTNNTALAGEDYESTSGTLTFSSLSNLDQTISVTINGDLLDDDNREFNLQFSNPTNGSLPNSTATIEIQDDDDEPTVRIDNASITEQDTGTTPVPVTLTLSARSKKTVQVDWSTSDGTATAGQDYESASGTATIAPNNLTQQISVNIINNDTDEPDRTFSVNIDSVQNASIEPDSGTATITIEDDDAAGSITIADFSVSESDGFATLTLETETPTEQQISIDYATVAGTALAGQDYTAVSSGQLIIPAYDPQNPQPQRGTIQIEILPNNFDEDDRSFSIDFSNLVNAQLSQSSVTVTITDDDNQPTLSFDTSTLQFTEIDDNTASASFDVTLDTFSRKSPQVSFATTSGTAIAGDDFTNTSGTLVFNDENNLTQTITVPIMGDLLNDSNRSFTVDFNGSQDLTLAASSRTIQINDDDPEPALSINVNSTITEGNSNQDVTVIISLSSASNLTVTSDYATSSDPQNNGAVDGVDYNATSGTVTFDPGETSKTFSVTVLGNSIDNADRIFTIATSNESGASAATATDVTIIDDDPTPSISIADVQVSEGDDNSTRATLTLQLNNAAGSGQSISVDYSTVDGTAIGGTDYTSASGSAVISPNNPSASLDITILGNLTTESNRAFSVNFSNPSNATLNTGTATVTILDDDSGGPTPGLSTRPSNTSCVASARPVSNSSVTATEVFGSISMSWPTQVIQSPVDTTRWYVVQRFGGSLATFSTTDFVRTTTLNLSITAVSEGGFLGVMFHPDFASNGHIFVSYTTTIDGQLYSMVERYTSADAGLTFADNTKKEIFRLAQPGGTHNGGSIRFGADGYLYFGLGDGGGSGDQPNDAQNTRNLYGAMIRLDVNTPDAVAYEIPSTNPFHGNAKCDSGSGADAAEDCPEIYAWGFRNPWQFNFDEETGNLWLGDVGDNHWEEVNIVELGGNYGWPYREGTLCHVDEVCPNPSFKDPYVAYAHADNVWSISGGLVYRGTAIPGLQGTYIFADYAGDIYYIGTDQNNQPTVNTLLTHPQGIASFAQDDEGEIYFTDLNAASIFKLEPAGDPPADTFPYKLSDTGCFNTVAQTPASGLVPFTVNQRLWSDGAAKDRYIALPDDTHMTVDANNDWLFPDGTVLVKNFSLNGTLFETRLLMKHADGWGGYSYEWNEAGDDADYVPGGKTKQVEGVDWTYPSSTQCFICHSTAANGPLGPETPAMNGDFTYPSTSITANQIFTLDHINMFTGDVPDPETAPAIPALSDTSASLEDRVKGYLHVNCSGCHRPGGTTPSDMDLRFQTALSDMRICNVDPLNTLGIGGAKLIAPGDTSSSIILNRMSRRDLFQMPPLGTTIVDTEALSVVSDWINSIGSCP